MRISKETFDQLMADLKLKEVDHENSGEVCYERRSKKHKGLVVRVWSTIDKRTGLSRPKNEDAIRAMIVFGDKILKAAPNTTRRTGWRKHLARRLRQLMSKETIAEVAGAITLLAKAQKLAAKLKCEKCGGPVHAFQTKTRGVAIVCKKPRNQCQSYIGQEQVLGMLNGTTHRADEHRSNPLIEPPRGWQAKNMFLAAEWIKRGGMSMCQISGPATYSCRRLLRERGFTYEKDDKGNYKWLGVHGKKDPAFNRLVREIESAGIEVRY